MSASHVGDVVGRAAEQRRRGKADIEPLAVARELRNIEIRYFARRLALGARGLFDLVLAGVGVGSHVADVGDVHHVADIVAV